MPEPGTVCPGCYHRHAGTGHSVPELLPEACGGRCAPCDHCCGGSECICCCLCQPLLYTYSKAQCEQFDGNFVTN